ncbi:MAG: hypothetical protein BWX47_01743 [candidate division Hyd24-12 bacterium ADurb.Bin004]|nr:MAG: hypothetical protein BWX47_01743 [candidate division Hyd24-12 bacterium ADurb.Bin004]
MAILPRLMSVRDCFLRRRSNAPRPKTSAQKRLERIPMARVTANPRIGPVPNL